MKLPWGEWEVPNSEVREVADKFVAANRYPRQEGRGGGEEGGNRY
jgi:hypothetical protein